MEFSFFSKGIDALIGSGFRGRNLVVMDPGIFFWLIYASVKSNQLRRVFAIESESLYPHKLLSFIEPRFIR